MAAPAVSTIMWMTFASFLSYRNNVLWTLKLQGMHIDVSLVNDIERWCSTSATWLNLIKYCKFIFLHHASWSCILLYVVVTCIHLEFSWLYTSENFGTHVNVHVDKIAAFLKKFSFFRYCSKWYFHPHNLRVQASLSVWACISFYLSREFRKSFDNRILRDNGNLLIALYFFPIDHQTLLAQSLHFMQFK